MDEPTRTHGVPLPRSFRLVEVASVVLCLGLSLVLAWRIVLGLGRGVSALGFAIAIALGYLGADLASGVVHFLADTFGSIDTPVLGKKFILPFREHHDAPLAMTEHDFVETNGDSCFAALLVLVPVLGLVPAASGGTPTLVATSTLVLVLLVVLTNQLHKWAHAPEAPRLVRLLQRLRIVLPPEEHAEHHRAPHDVRYCITSGALNPLLDRLGIFPAIARLARRPLPPPAPKEPSPP